jgi:hypothetical protein
MIGYKNMFYIVIGVIVLSGSCCVGFFIKEDFENRKKELTELKGFENLKIIQEEPDKKFKPKKTSKLQTQCNSNDLKSCILY